MIVRSDGEEPLRWGDDLSGRRALGPVPATGIRSRRLPSRSPRRARTSRWATDVLAACGEKVADLAADHGVRATAIGGDVTVTREVDALVLRGSRVPGGLDIVVCNAGHLVARQTIEQSGDEHFYGVVFGESGLDVSDGAGGHSDLRASAAGRVITMASLAAHNGGGPGSAAYAAAKAGIIGLTLKGLAKELAADAITVNALAPGFIGNTAFHDTSLTRSKPSTPSSPASRWAGGHADDVALAVVWLCSDGAGFVTGFTVDIDGGACFGDPPAWREAR